MPLRLIPSGTTCWAHNLVELKSRAGDVDGGEKRVLITSPDHHHRARGYDRITSMGKSVSALSVLAKGIFSR